MTSDYRKPDREDYEGVYRKRRDEEGRPGWVSEEQLATDLKNLEGVLESGLLPERGRLLEMGCGAGNIALHLAGRGYEVAGVDLSEEAIDWARENAERGGVALEAHAGDVTRMEILDRVGGEASFDIVLDGHCLHYLIDDEERARYLAVIDRALRPGGLVWVRSMCSDTETAQLRGGREDETRFDAERSLLIVGGVAMARIPPSGEIVAQVVEAGFELLLEQVLPAVDDEDLDELVCLARKPAAP